MSDDDPIEVPQFYDCERCGRFLFPVRAVFLYGESEGVILWSGGPYGVECAKVIARERWKRGQMTYRGLNKHGRPHRPYLFRGFAFGGGRAGA